MEHCIDKQREALQALQQASLAWWTSKRPVGWTLRKHLDTRDVNTSTASERAMATAVAAAVECGAISSLGYAQAKEVDGRSHEARAARRAAQGAGS